MLCVLGCGVCYVFVCRSGVSFVNVLYLFTCRARAAVQDAAHQNDDRDGCDGAENGRGLRSDISGRKVLDG